VAAFAMTVPSPRKAFPFFLRVGLLINPPSVICIAGGWHNNLVSFFFKFFI
jgi:hypothetical protein